MGSIPINHANALLSKFTFVWFGLLLSGISVKDLGSHGCCSSDVGSGHEMRLVSLIWRSDGNGRQARPMRCHIKHGMQKPGFEAV